MSTFKLRVSTPDGDCFSQDITELSLRGTEGSLAVLAGHIPFTTAVKPCVCRVYMPDDTLKEYSTDGGLLTVGSTATVLLTNTFTPHE